MKALLSECNNVNISSSDVRLNAIDAIPNFAKVIGPDFITNENNGGKILNLLNKPKGEKESNWRVK